jgi:hypothetical protein
MAGFAHYECRTPNLLECAPTRLCQFCQCRERRSVAKAVADPERLTRRVDRKCTKRQQVEGAVRHDHQFAGSGQLFQQRRGKQPCRQPRSGACRHGASRADANAAIGRLEFGCIPDGQSSAQRRRVRAHAAPQPRDLGGQLLLFHVRAEDFYRSAWTDQPDEQGIRRNQV